MGIAALLGFASVLATPTTPWSLAGVLVLAGLVGLREPRFTRIGVVAAWTAGIAGAGWLLLVPAIVLGAGRWSRTATGIVALGLLLALKQHIAAWELPASIEVVPMLLVSAVLTACAWAAATPDPDRRSPYRLPDAPRLAALLVLATGLLLALRVVLVSRLDGSERLAAARRVHAEALVYDRLVGADLAPLLVAAVPDRDEAALLLAPRVALDLGWRPQRAGDDPIPVALELERRGRGGEALRLLGRHRREGAVDWYRGLLERTQGEDVRWRGGVPEGVVHLPGAVALSLAWDTNAYAAVPFQADAGVSELVLAGAGTAFEGPPVVTVRVDAAPALTWSLDGAGTLVLPGPFVTGPHRLELRFESDRFGEGGDRNVQVDTLVGR